MKQSWIRSGWILVACILVACESSKSSQGSARNRSTQRSHRAGQRYLPDLDEIWDFSSPSESEGAFREVLLLAVESGDTDYHAQVLTQVARAQGLQRDFIGAHLTLDTAREMLPESTTIAGVRYQLERGRVFNSSGSTNRAKPLFLEAWENAKKIRAHVYAVDAAHMLAIVDSTAALHWNETALAYAEASGDERALRWRGALYNNIGWTWHDSRRYDKALDMFRKDLAFRVASKDDDGARIAQWNMARTLRSLGRHAEALDMQRDLALQYEQVGQVDGYVHEELGELLLAIGQSRPAKEQFGRAYDALSKDVNFATENRTRLQRIRRLGAR